MGQKKCYVSSFDSVLNRQRHRETPKNIKILLILFQKDEVKMLCLETIRILSPKLQSLVRCYDDYVTPEDSILRDVDGIRRIFRL